MRREPPRKKAKAKQERRDEIAELMSTKAQKKYERRLNAFVVQLDEEADKREEYTREILAVNDESVEQIVGHIADSFRRMRGEPKIVFEGQTVNAIKGEEDLLKSIQTKNFRWMAVRLLVASALWDIQIGSFKFPPEKCARCLKVVKKPRPRRKVK